MDNIKEKRILFIDFDKTLCHDRFWRSAEPALYSKIQERLFDSNSQLINKWMIGEVNSEQISEYVAEVTDIPYKKVWDIFVNDCKTMYISSKVLMKINSLRSFFQTVLVSDNMDCFYRFTVPALGLSDYFDRIVDSARSAGLKNDNNLKLLRDAVNAFGAQNKNCKLIDDSKSTCDLFSDLGGESYRVSKHKDLDYWLDHISNKFLPLIKGETCPLQAAKRIGRAKRGVD